MMTLLFTHLLVGVLTGSLGFYFGGRVTKYGIDHDGQESFMSKQHARLGKINKLFDRSSIAIIVASIAFVCIGLQGYWNQKQDDDRVEDLNKLIQCLNGFANANADSQQARIKANDAKDAARDIVFFKVLDAYQGKADDKNIAAALEDYKKISTEVALEKASNPYPDPPREVCD